MKTLPCGIYPYEKGASHSTTKSTNDLKRKNCKLYDSTPVFIWSSGISKTHPMVIEVRSVVASDGALTR